MSSSRFAFLLFTLPALLLHSCGSDTAAGPASNALPPPPPQAGVGGSVNPSPTPSGSLVCSQVYVYGIVVRVTDSSGNPITNAQVVIRDGGYTETLAQVEVPNPLGIYQGAGERPGSYQLTVSAPGYVSKTFDNLVVSGGVCHVTPVTREVSLLPY